MKRNPPITKTFTAGLCILALSPALVFAGNKASVTEERGLIKSVDMNAHTLVVTEHQKKSDQTFSWNDQTKFIERDKAVSADALKAGEHVRLNYTAGAKPPVLQSVHIAPAKTGMPTASIIQLQGAPAASPES